MSTLTLTLPNNYVEIEQEEMMYLDGGLTTAQKVLVTGVVAVMGVVTITAILTGALAVAFAGFSAVMKLGVMSSLIGAVGAKAAIGAVCTAIGASAVIVGQMINKFA